MLLLPKSVVDNLPRLYTTENTADPIVRCKFFLPGTAWTWYVLEYDGEDNFFGYVAGDTCELGYFSLRDLKGVRGTINLPIERDLYFKPQKLSVIRKLHE